MARNFLHSCWPWEGLREDERIQRGLSYKQFPTMSSCIRRYTTKTFMWIMMLQKIPLKMHAVYGSIELKQVSKVLKTKYQKVSTYFQLSQEASFDLLIWFSPWFWRGCMCDLMHDLSLVFPPISQLLQAVWSGIVQLFYLPFLDPYHIVRFFFYSAIQVTGDN